jgi:hypothetical protein
MVDIQTISIVIASAGVFVAAIYYVLQIRHQNKMRQTDLVMKLYSQFNSFEFQKAWYEVLEREAKDYYDYEKRYGFAEFSAIGIFFEGIGVLPEKKLISIELVDDMFTTPVKWTWEKMKDIALEWRKVRNAPEIFEWLEYLYSEMKKRDQQIPSKTA